MADDLTVNAVWERKWYGYELNGEQPIEPTKYTVQFYNGRSVVSTQQVIEGQDAVPPTLPAQAGYDFDGWDKDYHNVRSNLTIHAVWVKKKFTVKFLDEKTVLKTETVEYGGSATPPSMTNKENYYFKGWDDSYENVTSNKTINAVWERKWYGYEVNS